MDIKEKMKMCFNDELMENKILTENEKKVLASYMALLLIFMSPLKSLIALIITLSFASLQI